MEQSLRKEPFEIYGNSYNNDQLHKIISNMYLENAELKNILQKQQKDIEYLNQENLKLKNELMEAGYFRNQFFLVTAETMRLNGELSDKKKEVDELRNKISLFNEKEEFYREKCSRLEVENKSLRDKTTSDFGEKSKDYPKSFELSPNPKFLKESPSFFTKSSYNEGSEISLLPALNETLKIIKNLTENHPKLEKLSSEIQEIKDRLSFGPFERASLNYRNNDGEISNKTYNKKDSVESSYVSRDNMAEPPAKCEHDISFLRNQNKEDDFKKMSSIKAMSISSPMDRQLPKNQRNVKFVLENESRPAEVIDCSELDENIDNKNESHHNALNRTITNKRAALIPNNSYSSFPHGMNNSVSSQMNDKPYLYRLNTEKVNIDPNNRFLQGLISPKEVKPIYGQKSFGF